MSGKHIVVVGSSAAGLFVTLALCQRGHRVTLLEKSPCPLVIARLKPSSVGNAEVRLRRDIRTPFSPGCITESRSDSRTSIKH